MMRLLKMVGDLDLGLRSQSLQRPVVSFLLLFALFAMTSCGFHGRGGQLESKNSQGAGARSIDDDSEGGVERFTASSMRSGRGRLTPVSAKTSSLFGLSTLWGIPETPQPLAQDPLVPSLKVVENDYVRQFLTRYTVKERRTVELGLQRLDQVRDPVAGILHEFGLPQELLLVAFVESKFNPGARSPRGAVGMWQFIRTTAEYYGLRTGGRMDERVDMQRSTRAAARHLLDLYDQYEDWYLALAAYNAGVGSVNRAIVRSGKRDFFSLSREGQLPKETRDFVHKIIALVAIFRDPERFGFFQTASL